MTRYEALQKTAQEAGYCVGTFSTHAPNFYENTVLYVGVGYPPNRLSHLILKTWDVSYSTGRLDTGKNKWARALAEAEEYVKRHPHAPDAQVVEMQEQQRRADARRAAARARREKQRSTRRELQEQMARLRPTTLRAVADRLPESVIASFGLTSSEHEELLDEIELIAELDGQLLVKQSTLRYGPGWYRIGDPTTAQPVIALDCSMSRPV